MVAWLAQDNGYDYVRIVGASSTGRFGAPIYWAQRKDRRYDVLSSGFPLPPEFHSLRIPANAQPDPSSDSELTVYDTRAGYVAWLWHAHRRPDGKWVAGGGSIDYLASNGLDGSLSVSTNARNSGHRGLPPTALEVRLDELRLGAIKHVLRIAVNRTKSAHVFPMVGDESGCSNPKLCRYAPPEGTRIRISPSVDLSSLGLTPSALTIARALQTYGAVISDQAGKTVNLKVENTVAEGRGNLWAGLLTDASLEAIPLQDYEVIALGYRGAG
jgi:hypothetical protein